MKKVLCLIWALAFILTALCGCASLNAQPVTLADSIDIPDDGIIFADVFENLKQENKAVTFKGRSGDILYEWIVFGRDIKEAKNLNLGIEVVKADSEKIVFRFLSEENFGFSPALSVYLDDLWEAQSASLCAYPASDGAEKYEVSITGEKQSILNFSPEIETGTFIITPNTDTSKADTSASDDGESADDPDTTESSAVTGGDSEGTQTAAPSVTCAQTAETAPSPDSERTISDGKSAAQDSYKTDPVPAGKPLPAEPEDQTVDTKKSYTCTLSIECTAIFHHLSNLESDKLDILPKNGIIFAPQTVTFYEGESVYDVLNRVCRENGIHMESSFTPMYNSAYVEGIGNLYEFDCGSGSGWMYRVDGWYPNYGCSRYQLKDGEVIEWRYTCDLGKDIGGSYATAE